MSGGHPDRRVRGADLAPEQSCAMFAGEAMRAALVARDVTLIYRLLSQGGLSQREIARRTGQSQSEVSDIFRGRQVRDVTVLERIADGLGRRR